MIENVQIGWRFTPQDLEMCIIYSDLDKVFKINETFKERFCQYHPATGFPWPSKDSNPSPPLHALHCISNWEIFRPIFIRFMGHIAGFIFSSGGEN